MQSGDIYIADTWNHRVQRFDKNFTPLAQFTVNGWDSNSVLNKPYIALDANDNLPFIEFVDAAINTINAATSTVLVGWFSLRFTMGTRAAIGMQQWPRSCSVEFSTLPDIHGLPHLLSSLLDIGYSLGGKPHWGQRTDGLVTQGNGTIYPRLSEWRSAYARLSDNFQQRTFENDFSKRWELTTPTVS